MFSRLRTWLLLFLLAFPFAAPAFADDYADTIKAFQKAGESSPFFSKSYGYAVFPTVGTPTHELQRLGGWKTGSMVERSPT